MGILEARSYAASVRAIACILLIFLALGCDERTRPPPPPLVDAGPRMDSGPRDAGRIRRRDGGTTAPVIDGVIDDTEWEGAVSAELDQMTDRPGSVLTRLRARVASERLYVGIEATLAAGDVLVLYADRALGEAGGVTELARLTDEDTTLDDAISSPLMTPPSFSADFAWGTTTMPRTAVGLDAEMGWRDLAVTLNFAFIAAETAPTVCSETACETFIPLETLGGTRPRRIALFARIVRGDGGWTNQTLPMDDAAAPGIVSVLLEIDDGMVELDGGVPDAGPDAAPAGVVIDGVIAPGEWDGASMFTNSLTAIGSFAGTDASALYVARDATQLRVAIEGRITTGSALVMYLDQDVGSGLGLASPTPLDDFVGALDRSLSKSLITPSELRLDMAWGTLDMGRAAVIGDDRMGWREIGTNPSAYANVPGATVCGADACETSVALSALGVPAGAEIGLFVRLVSTSSTAFSNQTLPRDDALAPEIISTYVSIPAP